MVEDIRGIIGCEEIQKKRKRTGNASLIIYPARVPGSKGPGEPKNENMEIQILYSSTTVRAVLYDSFDDVEANL